VERVGRIWVKRNREVKEVKEAVEVKEVKEVKKIEEVGRERWGGWMRRFAGSARTT
jgi:heterodisulfide reductase subunit C